MKKKTQTFQEWSAQVSRHMTSECFKVMTKHGDQGDLIRYVAKDFIYNFVGSLVQNTLNDQPDGLSNKGKLDYVLGNYALLKSQVTDAVSEAFGHAMSDFTGEDVEYYCEIKPFAEPVNRRPI